MPEPQEEWSPQEREFQEKIRSYLDIVNEDVQNFAIEQTRLLGVNDGFAAQLTGKSLVNLGTSLIAASLSDESLNDRLFDVVTRELDQWEFEQKEAWKESGDQENS